MELAENYRVAIHYSSLIVQFLFSFPISNHTTFITLEIEISKTPISSMSVKLPEDESKAAPETPCVLNIAHTSPDKYSVRTGFI
jgi:hypothetical protein